MPPEAAPPKEASAEEEVDMDGLARKAEELVEAGIKKKAEEEEKQIQTGGGCNERAAGRGAAGGWGGGRT